MQSPIGGLDKDLKDSCFSPMTLSRNAVNNKDVNGPGVSAWPILQGHLNIQELLLSSEKAVKQFKNLEDMLDINFIEKYSLKPSKKRYFIFFKGKLYKFKTFDNTSTTCKILNVKYCQMDLISLQRPT